MVTEFQDDYPTCKKCYATLGLYHEDLLPDRVIESLGLQPSDSQVRGQPLITPRRRVFTPSVGAWFLSTEGTVTSRDLRRHLVWLLDSLEGRDDALARFRAEGYDIYVSCYWLSTQGHDGPTLSASILRRLGELELEIWFDFYVT